jgi:REP element-mobilizing transposase RayT
VVAVGVPHPITQRGNNRQDVFLSDEDRRRYQQFLRLHLGPCQAELLGWRWMSNHVHLIVVPQAQDSLARLIRRVHSTYAQDFNRRRGRDGPVWRSRFYCCALGPSHLDAALLYVDLNAVRAALSATATAWKVGDRRRLLTRPARCEGDPISPGEQTHPGARLARVVAVGVPHHITQRSNNRQDVFPADADQQIYLEMLRAETAHGRSSARLDGRSGQLSCMPPRRHPGVWKWRRESRDAAT